MILYYNQLILFKFTINLFELDAIKNMYVLDYMYIFLPIYLRTYWLIQKKYI